MAANVKDSIREQADEARDILVREADKILEKMTAGEAITASTDEAGVFHPSRLARVLILLAAAKLGAEIGYETMDRPMRLARKASRRYG